MITLIRVEIARMAARRMNRILIVVAAGLLVLAGVLTFFNSSGDFNREEALAQAEQMRQGFIEECMKGSFVEGPDGPQGIPANPEERRVQCEQGIGPAEDFIQDKRFRYADLLEILVGTSVQFILAMVVIGASAMGAEWANRTMTNTLTWEPRRSRVLGAKVIACAVFVFSVLSALMLWIMTVLLPSGVWRGTMEGVTWSWAGDIAETIIRIGILGALASVFALAVATITRNTAGSLAIIFAYLAIGESLVRGFKSSWQTWLLGNNISVVLTGDAPSYDPERTVFAAGVIVAVYAAVVVGGAWRFFTRADIA